MTIELPALPYAKNALEPHISERTLDFHYGKHHQTYVAKLNEAIADTPLENKSLEDIISQTAGDENRIGVFNNAAQIWNHTFYWNCMKPGGGDAPSGELAARIDAEIGGVTSLNEALKAAALGRFGSGWAWLVEDQGKLAITSTGNADLPMAHGQKALLTIDVWEHAYYLDYQNRRPDYVDAFLTHLINWEFVAKNL